MTPKGTVSRVDISTVIVPLSPQEMVGAHRGEVANLRQDRGLDVQGIAQTLQDGLIGGGGTLLALFQLCQVAIGGNAASILGATLAHLNPASVGTVLEHGLAGVAVLRQAPGDPSLTIAPRVLNETASTPLRRMSS